MGIKSVRRKTTPDVVVPRKFRATWPDARGRLHQIEAWLDEANRALDRPRRSIAGHPEHTAYAATDERRPDGVTELLAPGARRRLFERKTVAQECDGRASGGCV